MPSQRRGNIIKRQALPDQADPRDPKTPNFSSEKSMHPPAVGKPTIELAISDAERKLFAALFGRLIDQILAEPD